MTRPLGPVTIPTPTLLLETFFRELVGLIRFQPPTRHDPIGRLIGSHINSRFVCKFLHDRLQDVELV